jgi:mRNA interferase RelE/StbE
MWQIEFNDVAKVDLLRLDKPVRNRILDFLNDRVTQHPAPEQIAESLTGEFKGLHRFRVGDYRVVVFIRKDILTLLVLFVDHRSTVYKRRSLPSDFEAPSGEER